MRLLALAALASIVLASFALAPADARPAPYCMQAKTACPDDYCVDSDLDGRFTYEDTCIGFMCPTWGCCGGPCPPPMEAAARIDGADAPTWIGVCTEKNVNGGLVYAHVEYGTGLGCVAGEVGTCTLQYYPGEPNTPVWVCRPVLRL